jgi:hypothetical protein
MASDPKPVLHAPITALIFELSMSVLQYSSAITRRTVFKMRGPQSPTYVWCFWLLITLLIVGAVPANAAWVVIEKDYLSSGLETIYIDSGAIGKKRNLVTVWQLVDFKAMQGGRSPTRFFSTKTLKQFDCGEKRVRLLAFTEFTDGMGTGMPDHGYVDEHNWLPVEPQSVNQALWEVVCGQE